MLIKYFLNLLKIPIFTGAFMVFIGFFEASIIPYIIPIPYPINLVIGAILVIGGIFFIIYGIKFSDNY